MSRTVICSRYHQELPGLDKPPFPGPRGEAIFATVSSQAWEEWQGQQTMLINEKQLNMLDKDARKYLNTQRDLFLSGVDAEQAEGFIPPSD